MPFPNEPTERLLREQFAVISRPQLLRCGYGDGEVDGFVRRGRLVALQHGTYRAAGSADTPEQWAMAAILRCRPVARVTGPFVLGLLRVEGFSTADPFEILVPFGRRVRNVPFPVRTVGIDLTTGPLHHAMPLAWPARAYLDSARTVDGRRLLVGLDSGRWLGIISRAKVHREVERADPGDEGAVTLEALLDGELLDPESPGERAMKPVLALLEPPIEWGVWVAPDLRVDGLWRDVLIVLEYRGRRHHAARSQRLADADRDGKLRALGYEVVHITAEDLAQPAALLARLAMIRGRRLAAVSGLDGARS